MDQQYLELHETIGGDSFNTRTAEALRVIVDAISRISFLNVDHVVQGGSVGRGTAVAAHSSAGSSAGNLGALGGCVDAEAIFVVNGLPLVGHDRWLPPLLKAVHNVLQLSLAADEEVSHLRVAGDSVQMRVKGLIAVDVRFTPLVRSYAAILRLVKEQAPRLRRHYAPAFVKEGTLFITQQPDHVRMTIQLMKWWRGQQAWSDKVFVPSDATLETLAAYSAAKSAPADQKVAVANVMALLAQFDDLEIIWSDRYSHDNVSPPLLAERPLLMDPTNPFVNLASPNTFDAYELMSFARTTSFFM